VDVVAVVSGRSARDAQALVGVPGILVVGNHGLESITDFGLAIHPAAEAAAPRLKLALAELTQRIEGHADLAGVLVEDKGASASIHYRLTTDRERAHDLLTSWAEEIAGPLELKVTHGRMVVELRPPIAVNKGAAIRRIVDQFALEGILFFGDDVTDIDGFEAAKALRTERGIEAWSIAVADPEARPDVVEAADASVESVEACVTLLTNIAYSLENEPR
jgi:trehalose 6-phosphate phosphatase